MFFAPGGGSVAPDGCDSPGGKRLKPGRVGNLRRFVGEKPSGVAPWSAARRVSVAAVAWRMGPAKAHPPGVEFHFPRPCVRRQSYDQSRRSPCDTCP